MKTICLTAAVTLALFLSTPTKAAPPCCGFWLVDWQSWCVTAHTPFALERRIPYYVPRTPPCCATPRYWVDHCDCRHGCYLPETVDGFEPGGFEHLGQIPNDQLLDEYRPTR